MATTIDKKNAVYYSFATFVAERGAKGQYFRKLTDKGGKPFKVFRMQDAGDNMTDVAISHKIVADTGIDDAQILAALKAAGKLNVMEAPVLDEEGEQLTFEGGKPIMKYVICKDAALENCTSVDLTGLI